MDSISKEFEGSVSPFTKKFKGKMANEERKMAIYCEVCAEQFSAEKYIPRILQCGHTYCECCLDKLIQKSKLFGGIGYKFKIRCPKCKSFTRLNDSCKCIKSCKCNTIPAMLPKNFSYLDLIENVLENSRIADQQKACRCNEHPNYDLEMFCHDEEEAVCLKCTIYGQHKTHEVSKLSDFSDQQKTTIERNRSCLNDMIEDCKDLKAQLDERKLQIEKKFGEIQQDIIARFTLVQEKIKVSLDAKLEMVLGELNQMYAVQIATIETNDEKALYVDELEELRDQSENFLSEASQCDIAKEKDLISNMQVCLDEVKNHELTTTHMYEVRMDDTDQMLQVMEDLVGGWTCKVYETKAASTESVETLVENYSNKYFNKSLQVLFDEEQPSDELCPNPFDGIGCKWYNGT